MEQLNTALPETQEEKIQSAEAVLVREQEPLLLNQVRHKFGLYGGMSLIFGGFLALLFYKTWIGLNVLLFSSVIIILLIIIMKKLSLPVKTGTKLYFTGVILLGVSTLFTSSEVLQFLNILGILFLLDLSLLHQFCEDHKWSFAKHIGRMFGLVITSIASIGMPFADCFDFLKHIKCLKNDLLRNIMVGIVVSIPVLFVITALLSNADLLFGELTKDLFHVAFSADIFGIGLMIFIGFLACYCILCGALHKTGSEEEKAVKKADASIAITFMIILCMVYALFCGIQLIYLFAEGLFTLPGEVTFAQYARRGFFELLAVTAINIIIMLLCSTLFKESKLLRLLVAFMTACTYIMIASATYRMLLYIDAYHLTFLRLFVLLTLLIDAFVLAGVIISVYHKKFPLFRYCVTVISICYIAFSFTRPDYYIASYLTQQKEMLNLDDMRYMTQELSLDATPVVYPLLQDLDRWLPKAQQDNTANNDYDMMNEYDDSKTYQYYIDFYYNRINHVKNEIGIRDFNYSYDTASKYAIKFNNE